MQVLWHFFEPPNKIINVKYPFVTHNFPSPLLPLLLCFSVKRWCRIMLRHIPATGGGAVTACVHTEEPNARSTLQWLNSRFMTVRHRWRMAPTCEFEYGQTFTFLFYSLIYLFLMNHTYCGRKKNDSGHVLLSWYYYVSLISISIFESVLSVIAICSNIWRFSTLFLVSTPSKGELTPFL